MLQASKKTIETGNTTMAKRWMNELYRKVERERTKDGHSFELTFEQFFNISIQNCHYCNAEPSRKAIYMKETIMINGIDRKNNAIGYIMDNCVPCCWSCNKAKGTRDDKQFMEHAIILGMNQLEKLVESGAINGQMVALAARIMQATANEAAPATKRTNIGSVTPRGIALAA